MYSICMYGIFLSLRISTLLQKQCGKEIKIRVPIAIGISKIHQQFMTLSILVALLKQANLFLLKRRIRLESL